MTMNMNALKNTASSLFGSKRLGSPLVAATLLGAALMSGCGDDGNHCDGDTYWETHDCDQFVEKCLCGYLDPGNDQPTLDWEPPHEDVEPVDISNVCLGDHFTLCNNACAGVPLLLGWQPEVHDCIEGATSASCTGWNPSVYISASGGTRTFNSSLVTGLYSDPSPLYDCDTARISLSSSGYTVRSASTDDALYLAGLRNGDQLVSVNGYPITTSYELAYAYFMLWVLSDESPYTVVVNRGGTPTTLVWYIAWV
jgi:hypothetical protein